MASKKNINVMWFRQDLRLADNPALSKALEDGQTIPIFIFDNINSKDHINGSASKWWLHQSLTQFNKSLKNKLCLFKGNPLEILDEINKEHKIIKIFWNRCYEPWRIQRDKKIKKYFNDKDVDVSTFNGSLLWEPWNITKKDSTPYKVFTPYYRKGCLNSDKPRIPLPIPDLSNLTSIDGHDIKIEDLDLMPKHNWHKKMTSLWSPGEEGAQSKIDEFILNGLDNYKEGRNFPSNKNVSQLSPHLHFGEVSPNQVWYRAKTKEGKLGIKKDLDHFLSELGWREFSFNLLYHFPFLPKENLQKKFDNFPWDNDKDKLKKWQRGLTGYPIVDAGMQELWQTGYMHNRLRMVVGSFLVKNLLLHWHHGERWFWDCLIDADLASNSAGWQWIAGSGADAAPYFRIFNPVTQGQKFDPNGKYTKKYLPVLSDMPDKFLFNPWEAPEDVLRSAGVKLGENYPLPIVEIGSSRQKALEAFATTKTLIA
ncbi:DNA photolyase family protein [Pelagibacteraceae bacterium]|nr:DNA photolyase family protein [Pelagibacteraceae bacterium]